MNNYTSTDQSIATAFEKLYEGYKYLLWKKAYEHGLSPLQVQLLFAINEAGIARLSDLSKRLNTSKPTLSDAIKVLEDKSLLKRKKHSSDSRNHSISHSAAGKRLTEQLQDYHAPVISALANIPAAMKNSLLNSLLALIDELNRENVISVERMCFTCRYYEGDKQKDHFCRFINKPLQAQEIKYHCEEHAPTESL